MSLDSDPGFWRQISGWLWAALTVPLGVLWKKADNALSKQEFKEFVTESKEVRKELRDSVLKLFENAEEDRRLTREAIHNMNNRMHAMHIDLLDKIAGSKK
jgi:NH3-dependent NAD+ synthetase